MSHETFKIGEIAVYIGHNGDALKWSGSRKIPLGTEVEIISPYGIYPVRTDTGVVQAYRYRCRVSDGHIAMAKPEWLRKRRPPQDWVKLCQLDNLPRDIREPSHV